MTFPRRRFLGLVATPAAVAAFNAPTGGVVPADHRQGPLTNRSSTEDPQIQRLRSLDIDESVEPALTFAPRED